MSTGFRTSNLWLSFSYISVPFQWSTSPACNSSTSWLNDLFLAEMASWVDVCSCDSNCPLSNPPPFPLPDISRQIRVGYLTNLVVKVTRKMGIMKCKSVKVFRITFQQNLWHVSCCMEKFVYGLTQSVFYFKSVYFKPETPYKFLGKSPTWNLKKVCKTVYGLCVKSLCKADFIIGYWAWKSEIPENFYWKYAVYEPFDMSAYRFR